VLFVGNSLTASNDLPAVVAALARSDGRRLEYRTIAPGGYAIEDHWNQGDARAAIRAGGWDVVVLQQGPSALPSSQVELVDYAMRFDPVARIRGTRTGLYMVWPPTERATAFDSVATSYRVAAQAVGGVLFRAGDAWQAAWRADPGLALYSSDGFHPTVAGTYLAALVFYATILRPVAHRAACQPDDAFRGRGEPLTADRAHAAAGGGGSHGNSRRTVMRQP